MKSWITFYEDLVSSLYHSIGVSYYLMYILNPTDERYNYSILLVLFIFKFYVLFLLYLMFSWGLHDDENPEAVLERMKVDLVAERYNIEMSTDDNGDDVGDDDAYEFVAELAILDDDAPDLADKYVVMAELEDDIDAYDFDDCKGYLPHFIDQLESAYIDLDPTTYFNEFFQVMGEEHETIYLKYYSSDFIRPIFFNNVEEYLEELKEKDII